MEPNNEILFGATEYKLTSWNFMSRNYKAIFLK